MGLNSVFSQRGLVKQEIVFKVNAIYFDKRLTNMPRKGLFNPTPNSLKQRLSDRANSEALQDFSNNDTSTLLTSKKRYSLCHFLPTIKANADKKPLHIKT